MAYKANAKYKRVKCTLDQKVLKKVLTEVAKATAKDAKQSAPRDTGALYFGIGSKVADPKKDYRYVAIIGVKNSRYSKQTKKGLKIPNRYASVVNKSRRFMQRSISGKDNVVRQLLIQAKSNLIVSK